MCETAVRVGGVPLRPFMLYLLDNYDYVDFGGNGHRYLEHKVTGRHITTAASQPKRQVKMIIDCQRCGIDIWHLGSNSRKYCEKCAEANKREAARRQYIRNKEKSK